MMDFRVDAALYSMHTSYHFIIDFLGSRTSLLGLPRELPMPPPVVPMRVLDGSRPRILIQRQVDFRETWEFLDFLRSLFHKAFS